MCIEGDGAVRVRKYGINLELAVFRVLSTCHGYRHQGGGGGVKIDGPGSAPSLQQRGLP